MFDRSEPGYSVLALLAVAGTRCIFGYRTGRARGAGGMKGREGEESRAISSDPREFDGAATAAAAAGGFSFINRRAHWQQQQQL